jgi:hypothetical protein
MAVRAMDIPMERAWGGRVVPGRQVRTRSVWRWRWRVTRRTWARLVVAVLVPVAVLAMVRAAAGAARPGPAGRTAAVAPVNTVRVAPGDTLWSIAMRHAPAGTDPRPWIFRTAALNGVHDAELAPGEILRLPAGSR